MDKGLQNALTLFTGIMLTVYVVKPNVLFDEKKIVRAFGVGFNKEKERKTLFNLQMFVILIAILCFSMNVV